MSSRRILFDNGGNVITKPPAESTPEQIEVIDFGRFGIVSENAVTPFARGRHRLSGQWITEIWGGEARPIIERRKTGKKSENVQTGWEYYGTFAMLFNYGLVSELWEILVANNAAENADGEILFSTPILRPADTTVPTTIETKIGHIDHYWASANQTPSAYLQNVSGATQPARYHKNYLVFRHVYFGNQNTPPPIQIVTKTIIPKLDLTSHESTEGDAVGPEVAYEYLTDQIVGFRLHPDRIDKQSFELVAESLIADNWFVSPKKNKTEKGRTFLLRLAQESDFYYYETEEGKLAIGRVIPNQTPIVIDNNCHLIGPQKIRETNEQARTSVELTFTDFDRNSVESTVIKINAASNDNSEGFRPAKLKHLSITNPALADQIALCESKIRGLPPEQWELILDYQNRQIRNGHCLTFHDNDGRERRVIVQKIVKSSPFQRHLKITALADYSYLKTNPVGNVTHQTVNTVLDPASSFIRLSALPQALRGESKDGYICYVSREHTQILSASVNFTWSLTENWRIHHTVNQFQLAFDIIGWRVIRERYSALHIRFRKAHESQSFSDAVSLQGFEGLYVATCIREIDTSGPTDTHTINPAFMTIRAGSVPKPHPTAPNEWLIDVETGQLGTSELTNDSGDGNFPTVNGFILNLQNLATVARDEIHFERNAPNNPADLNLERYVRVQSYTNRGAEDFAAAPTCKFDRLDNTMSPIGTFDCEWGSAATINNDLGSNIDGQDPFYNAGTPSNETAYRIDTEPINDPVTALTNIFTGQGGLVGGTFFPIVTSGGGSSGGGGGFTPSDLNQLDFWYGTDSKIDGANDTIRTFQMKGGLTKGDLTSVSDYFACHRSDNEFGTRPSGYFNGTVDYYSGPSTLFNDSGTADPSNPGFTYFIRVKVDYANLQNNMQEWFGISRTHGNHPANGRAFGFFIGHNGLDFNVYYLFRDGTNTHQIIVKTLAYGIDVDLILTAQVAYGSGNAVTVKAKERNSAWVTSTGIGLIPHNDKNVRFGVRADNWNASYGSIHFCEMFACLSAVTDQEVADAEQYLLDIGTQGQQS